MAKQKQGNTIRFSLTLDKNLDRWIRVQAAKNDMSRNAYIYKLLNDHRETQERKGRE